MSQNEEENYPFPENFDFIVDHYNKVIQMSNQLRKTKNEEFKASSPGSKQKVEEKYKTKFEENSNDLKKTHGEFVTLIEEYLKNYKISENLSKAIIFPAKMIGEFRKSVHDIAEKMSLFHESIGSGVSRKLVVSKEVYESQVKKKIKKENPNKNLSETKKIEVPLSKMEFPPDEIVELTILSITSETVTIKITPPETYGSEIKSFAIYSIEVQEPDSENALFKFDNQNNSIKLQTSEFEQKNGILIFKFKLSAINDYGESFLSAPFQIQLNSQIKGKAFVCGSSLKNKIPCETLQSSLGKQFYSEFIEIPLVSCKTNCIRSHDTTLILLDEGLLIQCGLSLINESEDSKSEDILNQIYSEPFLPCPNLLVYKVSVGKDFCALVSCLGEVFTWGYNEYGQLGHDDRNIRAEPTLIKSIKPNFINDISCGHQHCLALECSGKVFTWGRNQALVGQKQVLDPYGKINNFENVGVNQYRPRYMKEVLGYYQIKKISAGGFHNAVITEKNELYIWGDNESCQLGSKELNVLNITIPRSIELFQEQKMEVLDISCGGLHSLALLKACSGIVSLWSWGDETQGQCGSGEKKIIHMPSIIKAFEGKSVEKFSAGSFHSLVLIKDEGLFGFGFNGNCEIGMTTQKKKIRSPIKIEKVPKGKIKGLEAGFEISCLTITD